VNPHEGFRCRSVRALKAIWCDVDHNLDPSPYQKPWDYQLTPMSPQSPKELLESLRANLKHLDECPEIGKGTDVEEIRTKLVKRISDVERIVRLVSNNYRPRPQFWAA